ncbi:hypothetical protein F4810DRAFT_710706 [Camillea tinctor]|nr:hypothetical protein F4810DRAFT_710706 [Camillea tinctor]
MVAKLKRNSLGQHKTTSSLSTSRLIALPYTGLERPVSSSGIPLIDKKLKHSSPVPKPNHLRLAMPEDRRRDFSVRLEGISLVPEVATGIKSHQIDPTHRKRASHGQLGVVPDLSSGMGGRRRNVSVSEPTKSREKFGKYRWLSQLREWVSTSESSGPALQHFKQEIHQKPDMTLGNPQVRHPMDTLPSDAIKSGGPGHNPEEISFKGPEMRKKMRESLTGIRGTSRGSRSSSSHHSCSSTVAFGSPKEDI